MTTERGLLAGALGVLALQVTAARMPVWRATGAAEPLSVEAFEVRPPLVRVPGDGLRLALTCPDADPGCRAEAWLAVPPRPHPALVTGVGSRDGGLGARLVLVGPEPAVRFPGLLGRTESRVVTAAPDLGPGSRLSVALLGTGARATVRELSIARAVRSPERVFVLTAWWVAAGAWVAHGLRALMHADPGLLRWLSVLAPLVLVGLVMPSAWVDAVLLTFPGARAEDLGRDLFTEPTIAVAVQKVLGHGGGFLLVGWVAAARRHAPARVAGWLLVLAVLTESLQTLLPDRSGKLSDVVVDGVGAILGALVGRVLASSGSPPARAQ